MRRKYLEQADVGSDLVSQLNQGGLLVEISSDREVRLFTLHQLEEGLGCGVRVELGTLEVRQ